MTKPPNTPDEDDAVVELQEGFGEASGLLVKGVDPKAVTRLEQAAVRGAERRAIELARAYNLRTLLTYGGAFNVAVIGAAVCGALWEREHQQLRVTSTEAGISAAFRNGPQSAAMWLNLMRSNDPAQALAECTGSALAVQEGRRACSLPMWLDPPRIGAPGAAKQ